MCAARHGDHLSVYKNFAESGSITADNVFGAMAIHPESIFNSSSLPERILTFHPFGLPTVGIDRLINFMLEGLLENKRFSFDTTEKKLTDYLDEDVRALICELIPLATESQYDTCEIPYVFGSRVSRRMFRALRKCELKIINIVKGLPELSENGKKIKLSMIYVND